jgi:hypothetical protein
VPDIFQGKLYLGRVLRKGPPQDEAQDHRRQDQQDRPKNGEVDSHAVGQDDVSPTSSSTSLGSLDSISNVTATVTLLGTMDSTSTVLVTTECRTVVLGLA